jgi:hypothetical protein
MTLPITDFIVQKLLEFDPSYDVGSGSPTTGLLIEPLSIILQPIIDELAAVQATKSVLTILESSDPDGFPEDIVDALASNVFVERQLGDIGSDVERMRFFSPQAYSAQKGVLVFNGPAGQRYTNSEAVSVVKAEMSLNQDGSLYFVDIPIVALEEGSAYNVDAGGIVSMEAEPTNVANITNLYGVTAGRDKETNTELIDRIKVAVSVRALVTGRGIIVTLTENFTSIVEIYPIGMGQPEMMRDIVYNVHIGGNVDVYVKTAALASGEKDVFGLVLDATRTRQGFSTVTLLEESVAYPLANQSVDRTAGEPVVKSIDGAVTYDDVDDYVILDELGVISRPPGSAVIHTTGAGGTTLGKQLTCSGAFNTARPGMQLTILAPSSVAKKYTIKTKLSSDVVEVYGSFASNVGGVSFQVDDILSVSYPYNPCSVDIVQTARSSERADFTVTDVPVLRVQAAEVLDPLSGETTGEMLQMNGGYGYGGCGRGPYGIGTVADFKLVVPTPTLRFSTKESNYLEFLQKHIGVSVRLSYLHASSIPPIQAFCDDRDNQTEAASLIVKNFIPVFVSDDRDIEYGIAISDEATAISVDEMTVLVKQFIDDVDAGKSLEFSDLVDLLYNNGAVRVDLGALMETYGVIQHTDGTIEFVDATAQGLLTIPSAAIPDPTPKPLSPRIARFIAENITLKRVSE